MDTFNFESLNLKKVKKAIDIGCGNGRHLKSLGFRLKKAEIFGVDQLEHEIHKLNNEFDTHVCKNGNSYSFSVQDIRAISFEDNSFDMVICSEVLEHVADVDATLKELTRLLKPGGNLLISVPSYFPEKICWLLSKGYQNMPGGHVRIFRKSVLQEKVEEKGYNLERTEKYHALHSPYWWLRCLFWSSQDSNFLVKVYKKILEIQILRNPMILRVLDNLLNPFLGKSTSFYFKKL